MAEFDFLLQGPWSTGFDRADTRRRTEEEHATDQAKAITDIMLRAQEIEEKKQINQLREKYGAEQIEQELRSKQAQADLHSAQAKDVPEARTDSRTQLGIDQQNANTRVVEAEIQREQVRVQQGELKLARERAKFLNDQAEAQAAQLRAQAAEDERETADRKRTARNAYEQGGMSREEYLKHLDNAGRGGGTRISGGADIPEVDNDAARVNIMSLVMSDPELGQGNAWAKPPGVENDGVTTADGEVPRPLYQVQFESAVKSDAEMAFKRAVAEYNRPRVDSLGRPMGGVWVHPELQIPMESPPVAEWFYNYAKDKLKKYNTYTYEGEIRYFPPDSDGTGPFDKMNGQLIKNMIQSGGRDAQLAVDGMKYGLYGKNNTPKEYIHENWPRLMKWFPWAFTARERDMYLSMQHKIKVPRYEAMDTDVGSGS